MVEDPTMFFRDFAVAATLAGNALSSGAIVDTQSVVELDGLVTQGPSARVVSSEAPAAAPGQSFVAGSVTYSVRQVLAEPPDGVTTRLILTRA